MTEKTKDYWLEKINEPDKEDAKNLPPEIRYASMEESTIRGYEMRIKKIEELLDYNAQERTITDEPYDQERLHYLITELFNYNHKI